jgi:hypothetical protein
VAAQLVAWERMSAAAADTAARAVTAAEIGAAKLEAREVNAAISGRVAGLYGALSTAIRAAPETGGAAVRKVLTGVAWIWTGQGFAPIERVARSCRVDCRPYLHTLSPAFVAECVA